ncbi:DUF5808 domain-containing protein [Bacillus sp. JJ1532]|uniref:DUF1648 domain-containing protein n=1 Tax=unclassified Bacillus (in: firmicutes) TaxID=185979 RepID=UPI002FFEFC26
MDFLLFLIIIVFLVAIQMATPFLVKRNIVFGVFIPDEYDRDAKLISYKKIYAWLILIFGLIGVAIYLVLVPNGDSVHSNLLLLPLVIQFSLIFVSIALYFYFHAKTIQCKKQMGWGENLKQLKVTDLSVRSKDEMLPWYLYLLPMVVTIGIIGYSILKYSLLPEQIPTHWGPNGKPDAFTGKNPFSSISLPLIMLTMQVMFLSINEMTKRSGIKLSATRTEASRIRQLTLRKYSSWFMFLTNILITLLFSFLQLQMIHPNLADGTLLMAIPLIFVFVILISSVLFALKVGTAGEKTDIKSWDGISDFDEDRYWKGGLIYFNKNDPSIFIEKRFGIGWTLNFANPIGYIILFGPLAIILFISFFG